MVYESDFYTTRRYRTSPSLSTYTVTKREIPWEKVPFVPRPSLVPDPITAYGRRRTEEKKVVEVNILDPLEKAKIRPKTLIMPPKPYVSARELTKERVFTMIRRDGAMPSVLPRADAMDVVLPRLHNLSEVPSLPYKRRLAALQDTYYY